MFLVSGAFGLWCFWSLVLLVSGSEWSYNDVGLWTWLVSEANGLTMLFVSGALGLW